MPTALHLPQSFALPTGQRLTLRRLASADLALLTAGYARQSAAVRRARFHCAAHGAAAARLLALLQAAPGRQAGWAVVEQSAGTERFVAEAGLVIAADGRSAEFGLLVDGAWQRRGIGRRLLHTLIQHAREAGVQHLRGLTLADNIAMQSLARGCGFAVLARRDGEGLDLELAVGASRGSGAGWWAALCWALRPA
jgi:acetyltransferase